MKRLRPPVIHFMKLSIYQFIIIFCFTGLSFAGPVGAQEILAMRVTIHADNQQVRDVLRKISEQTKVRFTYGTSVLSTEVRTSIQAENQPLGKVLDELFAHTAVNYEVLDKQVILTKSEPKAGNSDSSTEQKSTEKTIKGSVRDEKGEALPGVSIIIKKSLQGTSTDEKGNFTLSLPEEATALIFSYVGYIQQEISINNQSSVQVTLLPDTKALDEFIVVGYGTQKKSDVTGAISRLSEEQIRERPVQNVVQALQGKAAGVDITSNLRPGEVGRIRIRGNRSINASNEPLYVIDGIPLSASEVTAINPNDIASIEILKDASATAIYGSRGANGVILITYKEGKKGKTSINYDVSYTASKIHSVTDWMGSKDLLNWQRQAHINGGTYTGKYGTAPDPAFDIQTFGGGEQYGINSIRSAYEWNEDGTVKLRAATAQETADGYAGNVPVYNPANLLNQNWPGLVTRTGKTPEPSAVIIIRQRRIPTVSVAGISQTGWNAVGPGFQPLFNESERRYNPTEMAHDGSRTERRVFDTKLRYLRKFVKQRGQGFIRAGFGAHAIRSGLRSERGCTELQQRGSFGA
jgi:TonB-dependent SusC/RagA subfamily outer membrane receptor